MDTETKDNPLSRYPIAEPENMDQALSQIRSMRIALTRIYDAPFFSRRRIAANCIGFWQSIAGKG